MMPNHPTRQAGTIARFRTAQDKKWRRISLEIARGRKETHWMWYVFPQLKVFAKSETAYFYGIADSAEALAYLDDPVLRVRLASATAGVLNQRRLMFNDIDKRKLHRCMTLFGELVKDRALIDDVIGKHFAGELHQGTLDALAGKPVVVPGQWRHGARSATAMGRVELKGRAQTDMARHWEKQIERARATVAAVGTLPDRTTPMSSEEVTSFIKGFGLSPAATRAIVTAWIEDQSRANEQGWEARADAEYWNG